MKMPLSQLRDLLDGVPAELECSVGAITQDSRAVVPGGLFLARSGFNRHGLDFLDEVLAQGAVAVLAEPDQRWPQERIEALAQERQLTLLPVANLGHRASAIAGAFYGNPSDRYPR